MEDRVAFIHLMKTAGTYVGSYLATHVLGPAGVPILNGPDRDWTDDELRRLLVDTPGPAYVHNHLGNWREDTVAAYQAAGFRTFAFVRHPGDQWCSFYHWAREKPGNFTRRLSLDDFLRRAWTGRAPRVSSNMDPPTWWRRLDHCEEFSGQSFAALLRDWYGHEYRPGAAANRSSNQGYAAYREAGLVSDEVHELLLTSSQWTTYREVTTGAVPPSDQQRLARVPERPSSRPLRPFVVLFLGGSGSSWFIDLLGQHPQVTARREVFSHQSRRTAEAQLAFVETLAGRRSVVVRGFKVRPAQVVDWEAFVDAVQRGGMRVIHLERRNVVKHAIARIRKHEQAARLEEGLGAGAGNLRVAVATERPDLVLGRSRVGGAALQQMIRRITAEADDLRRRVAAFDNALTLAYEDLMRDTAAAMATVERHLGIPPFDWAPHSTRTVKITSDDLRLTVQNFDELAAELEGTPYLELLKETGSSQPLA